MDAGLGTALILGGIQGATTIGGLYASKYQSKVDKARISYETAQAELAAADAAYENTRSYRRALGAQILSGSIRGAPGSSPLVQFTMDTFANYARDQAAISRRGAQAQIAGNIATANMRSERLTRDLGLVSNYFSSAFSGVNLNSLGASLGKAPGASSLSAKIKGR